MRWGAFGRQPKVRSSGPSLANVPERQGLPSLSGYTGNLHYSPRAHSVRACSRVGRAGDGKGPRARRSCGTPPAALQPACSCTIAPLSSTPVRQRRCTSTRARRPGLLFHTQALVFTHLIDHGRPGAGVVPTEERQRTSGRWWFSSRVRCENTKI